MHRACSYGCSQIRNNTEGSYNCFCLKGFFLPNLKKLALVRFGEIKYRAPLVNGFRSHMTSLRSMVTSVSVFSSLSDLYSYGYLKLILTKLKLMRKPNRQTINKQML